MVGYKRYNRYTSKFSKNSSKRAEFSDCQLTEIQEGKKSTGPCDCFSAPWRNRRLGWGGFLSGFQPQRGQTCQPRATPWVAEAFDREALKGRDNRLLSVCCVLSGLRIQRAEPGRRPGLICLAPLAARGKKLSVCCALSGLRIQRADPGRCPGLICLAPSGQKPRAPRRLTTAKTNSSQNETDLDSALGENERSVDRTRDR